jgi:hypothetical protein
MALAFIKSIPVRFRRAGLEFNRAGRKVDLNTLTKDQVEALYAEPNLQVTLLELPKKAAKITPPALSDAGIVSPAGSEPPAGADTSNPPAASGTQQRPTGDEQTPAAAEAAVVSASAEAGTGGPAAGSELRMPRSPTKAAKVKKAKP